MRTRYKLYFAGESRYKHDVEPFFTATTADEFMQKLNFCIERDGHDLASQLNRGRFYYSIFEPHIRYADVQVHYIDDLGNIKVIPFKLMSNPTKTNPNGVSVPREFYAFMDQKHNEERNHDRG